MISRCPTSVPNDDVVWSRLLYCDSRCSQTCCRRSKACCQSTPTCHRSTQTCWWRTQTCCQPSQVLPGAPNVLSGALRYSQTYHNHSLDTPVPVIRDLSYSDGRPECPPSVWYSPDIDASMFTLHIISDTPGGFLWLKSILQIMFTKKILVRGFILLDWTVDAQLETGWMTALMLQ